MRFDRPRPRHVTLPSPASPASPAIAAARLVFACATCLTCIAGTGCDRPPSPTREWTPQDHDRADEQQKIAAGAQAPAKPRGSAAAGDGDEARSLAEMTWRQQCASCHGPVGHGDGPSGPMVKASNLTDEAWQAKVSDSEIAVVIKSGKNKMPKFDLPDSVIAALVGRIRASRGH